MRDRALLTGVLVAALVVAALGSGAASAQSATGSIVFIQGGNVHLANPDFSEIMPVTTGGGWSSPSMADDGTIVAISNGETIVRMTQGGAVIGEPFDPDAVFASGISRAVVSNDGTLVAYDTHEPCTSGGQLTVCMTTAIVPADGSSTQPLASVAQENIPSWYPGGEVMVEQVRLFGPGDDESTEWFAALSDAHGLDVSRDERYLAIAGNHEAPCPPDDCFIPPRYEGLAFWALSGPPPAQPTRVDCFVEAPEGAIWNTPTWSPDASALLVGEQLGDDFGVVYFVLDVEACTADQFFLPDASEPFWSPAPFDPQAPPTDEPTDGPTDEPTDGPTDEPTDGPTDGPSTRTVRLDFGGAADPVAQAIGLSLRLFPEGGSVRRVVLATADRFPDALAGSALAGDDGPILFTPTGQPLDPRVEEEIARVTGGDGVVLTLGGTAAVSEEAAAAARAAAGDRACAVPLPSTCRFAGSGREETAALIADVVVAEHPDAAGTVLVARGDDFADAITGGAFAAAAGIPILLTPTDLAHPFTREWLSAHGTQLLVALGGTAAISDPTLAELPAGERTRVFGPERTATSAAIAEQLWRAAGGGSGGVTIVNVRHQDGWQTALSAAVASALFDAPQLGVENPPAGLSDHVEAYLATVPADTPVLGLGDTALVSDAQLEAVAAARG